MHEIRSEDEVLRHGTPGMAHAGRTKALNPKRHFLPGFALPGETAR